MNQIVENILAAYKSKEWKRASSSCEEYISACKLSFMENLTADTATNFAGSVILFAQICAGEHKPWKAIPKLEDARGCLRFMEDFIQDREVFASTLYSFATSYEMAGFAPEALQYYRKVAEHTSDFELLENAAYSAYFFSLREHGEIESSLKKAVETKIGKETSLKLVAEAKEALSKLPKFDPIEQSEAFLKIRYDLETRIDQELSLLSDDTPFFVRYWECKKRILLKEFGLTWKTPAECNPNMRFS